VVRVQEPRLLVALLRRMVVRVRGCSCSCPQRLVALKRVERLPEAPIEVFPDHSCATARLVLAAGASRVTVDAGEIERRPVRLGTPGRP
jgi:hypothetical protein